MTREQVEEALIRLYLSCNEGYHGIWDCTFDEGKEGFLNMSNDVLGIAKSLDIEIPKFSLEHYLSTPDEEDEDDE